MKWFIYLLLLLNVALFGWGYREGLLLAPKMEPKPALPPPELPQSGSAPIQRLLLLSEVDTEALQPPVTPSADTAASNDTPETEAESGTDEGEATPVVEIEEPVLEQVEPTPIQVEVAEEMVELQLTEEASSVSVVAAANGPTPEEATDVPTSPPEAAPGPLQSESVESPPREDLTALEQPAPIELQDLMACYTIGPLPEKETEPAESAAAWLKARGARVQTRWTAEKIAWRYWVYLPPFPNTEEARAMLGQLKSDGITDYMRIHEGEMVNAISLGFFSKEKSARNRTANLRKKGYEPSTIIRYKEVRKRWLDAGFSGNHLQPDEFGSHFPELQPTPVECVEVFLE